MSADRPPTGTVTFLFTDLERSTRLWEEQPGAMAAALRRHDVCVRTAIASEKGYVFATGGDGFAAAFGSPTAAAVAAIAAQRTLAGDDDGSVTLHARMAMHTGVAEERDGSYFGAAVNRTARLMATAHGGQVLVSQTTHELLRVSLPPGLTLVDLGRHRLRDLPEPQRVFQLNAAGLPADFPPLRSIDVLVSNLPVPRTTFVGRERDVATLAEFVGSRQLTTLTGTGGCGKTRLAIEVARAVLDDFPDGVWFVDLSAVGNAGAVAAAVASGIRMPSGGPSGWTRPLLDDLTDFLRDRTVLLILDNCEHLLDACADLVDSLLPSLPMLRVLSTSREPLGMDGEQVYRVPSLATAGAHADAHCLFVDRARLVDPHFAPTESLNVVADICRRLDGIPLAIELAAASVAHLSPADIVARLDDRFTLLHGGRRRTPRQQTLMATVDWSHALLDPQERVVLRRTAVFAAGFTLAAAQGVCAATDLTPSTVTEAVASLVRRSMIQAEPVEGGRRYRLLETIRLYAQQQLLAAGEAEAMRARHRDWFVAWARETNSPAEWAGAVRPERAMELDNVRAALDWCEHDGRIDHAVRLLEHYYPILCLEAQQGNVDRFARIRARLSEPGARDAIDLVDAHFAQYRGDFVESVRLAEQLREHASRPDVRDAATALLAFTLGASDPDRARVLLEELERTGASSYRLHAARASFALMTGDYAAAIEAATRLVPQGSVGLTTIAAAHHLLGDHDEADTVADQLEEMALRYRWPGDHFSTFFRALTAAARGNHAEARIHGDAMLQRVERSKIPLGRADAVLARGIGALLIGEAERASELFAAFRASAAWPFRSPATFAFYRHYVSVLRGTLAADVMAGARGRGRSLSLDEALRR